MHGGMRGNPYFCVGGKPTIEIPSLLKKVSYILWWKATKLTLERIPESRDRKVKILSQIFSELKVKISLSLNKYDIGIHLELYGHLDYTILNV